MKPIESAPKDGSQFLAKDSKTGIFVVLNQPPNCALGVWSQINGEWCGSWHPMADKVTHWTELPSPDNTESNPK